MKVSDVLKKVGINPEEPVLLITAEEAMENLLKTIEEFCPNLKIDKMRKEDVMSLLNTYANCIIDYHPESSHQERGTLLKNFEMLKNYGLTDDDYNLLDFY